MVQRKFEGLKRFLRILKRKLDKKTLPANVYRIDAREPNTIAVGGFQPWKEDGNISIKEHVTGSLDQAMDDGSTLAKYQSQYVSTASYKGLADGVLANISMDKYLYKIDTGAENLASASFTDVNDYFDRIGRPRPYPKQREWIKEGGIPGAAIPEYIDAPDFFTQGKIEKGQLTLPDEGSVTGWQNMPQPAQTPALTEISEI